MKKLLVLVLILGWVAFGASQYNFSQNAAKRSNPDFRVKIKDDANGNQIVEVEGVDSNCTAHPNKPGCVEVPEGRDDLIVFKLQNPNIIWRNPWHFSKFEICPWDAAGVDGKRLNADTTDCTTLTAAQAADFQARTPNGTPYAAPSYPAGVMDLSAFPGDFFKLHRLFIQDFNSIPMDYFYRIEVCKDRIENPVCLWSDPPLVNKGRGHFVKSSRKN